MIAKWRLLLVNILGIVDDSYDRLYKEISKLSISRKCFLLTFETGEEIKAIRLQQQERVEYDEHGYFLSSIRFVKVNSFDIGKYQHFLETYPAEDEIVVCRNNMPIRVAYLIRGEPVYIMDNSIEE